jgi:hypothetical protein
LPSLPELGPTMHQEKRPTRPHPTDVQPYAICLNHFVSDPIHAGHPPLIIRVEG